MGGEVAGRDRERPLEERHRAGHRALPAIGWVGRLRHAALEQELRVRRESGDRRIERAAVGRKPRRVARVRFRFELKRTRIDMTPLVVGNPRQHRSRAVQRERASAGLFSSTYA